MLGVVLSLLLYVWRASRPHVAELGRLPGSEHFRNIKRYDNLETWPEILLLRVDENLSFANSAYLEETIMERVAHKPLLEHLVLVASGINGVDLSALETLAGLAQSLRSARGHAAPGRGQGSGHGPPQAHRADPRVWLPAACS